eukprot:Nitzschia sp. Nitz4//scaffold107_size73032//46769//48432//NITZ4_005764-RA/size73032-processed-gene-0.111-mRNA-1//1//CDS//3329532605//3377//frame0
MVQAVTGSRWQGEARYAAGNGQPRNYVDFGDQAESEAAVGRWLSPPVSPTEESWKGARHSDPGAPNLQECTLLGVARARSSAGDPLTARGKHLFKERIRLKPQYKHQESWQSAPPVESSKLDPIKTNLSKPVRSQSQGNITPSTAASTRSQLSSQPSHWTESESQLSPSTTRSSPSHQSRGSLQNQGALSPRTTSTTSASQEASELIAAMRSATLSPTSAKSSSPRRTTRRARSSVGTSNSKVSALSAMRQPTERYAPLEKDEERERVEPSEHCKSSSVDKRQALSSPVIKANRIRLHVYDLIANETIMQIWGCHFPIGQCFNAVNSGLHTLGTGAYHVGIEVNGVEYAFGANSQRGMTGVFSCMPKCSPGYQYRTTIDLGEHVLMRPIMRSRRRDQTGLPQGGTRSVDGREVLREMATEYMGTDYDLLRKNCVTFSHDACLRLGVRESEIPDWFRNLCVAGAAAQDAANSTIEPLSKVFSSCDMEVFSEMVEGGFEVVSDSQGGDDEVVPSVRSPRSSRTSTSMRMAA